MPYHATLHLGEIGLLVAFGVGLVMALGVKAPVWERLFVALLRACLSGGLFLFIFEGMRLFAKIGDVPLAVPSWAFACVLALLLARLTPAGGGRGRAGR